MLVFSLLKQISPGYCVKIESEDFYFVNQDFTRKMILMTIAPHYILAMHRIPLADSDTHTIAIAELYGAERVILVKRTDGIYDYDPYRGFTLDPITGECADIERWREAQQNNRRHGVVTIDQLLSTKISREGTGVNGLADGSTGHLMEDSALRYFQECEHVKEVVVVHVAPEEMYFCVKGNEYEHIVTGERLKINQEVGWRDVLADNLRKAFQGVANSKIIRG